MSVAVEIRRTGRLQIFLGERERERERIATYTYLQNLQHDPGTEYVT